MNVGIRTPCDQFVSSHSRFKKLQNPSRSLLKNLRRSSSSRFPASIQHSSSPPATPLTSFLPLVAAASIVEQQLFPAAPIFPFAAFRQPPRPVTAGLILSTPVSLFAWHPHGCNELIGPDLMLFSSSLAAVKPYELFRWFSGFVRRGQATTGHPIHGGRWWWISTPCIDVFQALVLI